ncbi:tryptophan-rich sensory protein [Arenibacter sp. H213]|nr:tryptophan-rich sensory protein [Arenibacter sp. H213]
MMDTGRDILVAIRKRWMVLWALEVFLYALGPAIFLTILGVGKLVVIITFGGLLILLVLLKKPWKLTLDRLCATIDKDWAQLEYSTGLMLLPKKELSSLAVLQKYKVTEHLRVAKNDIKPETHFKRATIILCLFIVLGILSISINGEEQPRLQEQLPQQQITFKPKDSTEIQSVIPALEKQRLSIRYPAYTKLPMLASSTMEVKALEGSRVAWNLQFNTAVDSVFIESMGTSVPMQLNDGEYRKEIVLRASGFYNFRFVGASGKSFFSELYPIEVTNDRSPTIEIQDIDQFTSFNIDENKELNFNVYIKDDYGIGAAYIIATVSKGTGESVKFREVKMDFDKGLVTGSRNMTLSKKLDLDKLKMEAGDELYFYVEASDQKEPNKNTSRSETYFAVIRDTVSSYFAVEGSLGADLMPDYFRSQRQLIIDTEKLIGTRSSLPKTEFNYTSNELGFDQKALRIKYGEFMGDETEMGSHIEEENLVNNGETNSNNPLEEYTHDHDGDNSHNLVDHEHQGEQIHMEKEDPLESYLHNHDDPEESTLFTQSLKSKLRQAMDQMWDAELQLRLFAPEKSLPYQYSALKLIQEIKNSARIYVHRIGFDPPPIKETVRLSGKLDDIASYQKIDRKAAPITYPSIRTAIVRLEKIKDSGSIVSEEDRVIFGEAGHELAAKAIEEPGKYLNTLQLLKKLVEKGENSRQILWEVQRGLLFALPKPIPDPKKDHEYYGEMQELLLMELQSHD